MSGESFTPLRRSLDVDRASGLIHVSQHTKTGPRQIPISETAAKVLDEQVRHLNSSYVFVDEHGNDYASDGARNKISRDTSKAMKKAGIEDASFHTLRHTAAAWMVQAGVPLYEVQHVLGHSTPVMTQRYAHLQPGHLRKAVTALDDKFKTSRSRETSTATNS